MNISQVFYLARCASKTPEEREEINQLEERYAAVNKATEKLKAAVQGPKDTDVGSAHLILALQHSHEAAEVLRNSSKKYYVLLKT